MLRRWQNAGFFCLAIRETETRSTPRLGRTERRPCLRRPRRRPCTAADVRKNPTPPSPSYSPLDCQWNVREALDPSRTSTTYEEHSPLRQCTPPRSSRCRAIRAGVNNRAQGRDPGHDRSLLGMRCWRQRNFLVPSRRADPVRVLTAQRSMLDRRSTPPTRCASERCNSTKARAPIASSELLLIRRA